MSSDNIDATGDDLLVDFVAHLLQQESAIAKLQRSCDQASERIDSLNIAALLDCDRPPPPTHPPNPVIPSEPAADSHKFSGQQASSRLKRHACPMLHRKRCVPAPRHRIFFRIGAIPDPDFQHLTSLLLSRDTFFVILHNKDDSREWSSWLQGCEDSDNAFCFATADRVKTRIYAASSTGREQWTWSHGTWQYWLVRGQAQCFTEGLDCKAFDQAVHTMTAHTQRWDRAAQHFSMASRFASPEDGQHDRQTHWTRLRDFWINWDKEALLRKHLFEQHPTDWHGIARSCTRMASLLAQCPDTRLRRIAM